MMSLPSRNIYAFSPCAWKPDLLRHEYSWVLGVASTIMIIIIIFLSPLVPSMLQEQARLQTGSLDLSRFHHIPKPLLSSHLVASSFSAALI